MTTQGWLMYLLLNLINFVNAVYESNKKSGLSTGAVVGVALGSVAGAAIVSTVVTIIIMRRNAKYRTVSKKRSG
jgi:hypothetical protein